MFKTDAKLFLSATNNINSAKTLINECKRLIIDFDLEGDSNCKNLKGNINRCNIDELVSKVEETNKSLIKLDESFAKEYMALLQEILDTSSIDTSSMTDEEKMQYSIQMDLYVREYNQTLLYMLEKYDESGMLTDEMKQQLEYQRELIAQYDIKDKMVVLDPLSDEYISLFKQCADYDRKLINLNPILNEEQKSNYLKEYDTQYNKSLTALQQARDQKLKNEKLEQELEDLYESKESNNGFLHPFVESEIDEAILDKKIEISKLNPQSPYAATEDEIAYKNMNGWDRFWTNTGTFVVSAYTGLFDVVEGIGDGVMMLSGAIAFWDKEYQSSVSEYVSRDLSGELYQGIQLRTNMNSFSAYGMWHSAGTFVGEAAGTIMLQYLPGGTLTMVFAHGLKGMGQGSEKALNEGLSFYKSFGYGVGNGAIEAGASYFLYGKTIEGAKILDTISKKFPITKIFGKFTKKLASYGGKGIQNYVGKYASEKFASKLIISAFKEYLKEGNSYIIDGEIDFKSASAEAAKSMLTTTINELLVSPVVDKVASKTTSNKYKRAENKYEKAKRRRDLYEEKIEKIKEKDTVDAKKEAEDLLSDAKNNKMDSSVGNTNRYLEKISKHLVEEKAKMDNAYNNITLWDLLVKEGFVNKFAKKISSGFMKDGVYNELGLNN